MKVYGAYFWNGFIDEPELLLGLFSNKKAAYLTARRYYLNSYNNDFKRMKMYCKYYKKHFNETLKLMRWTIKEFEILDEAISSIGHF